MADTYDVTGQVRTNTFGPTGVGANVVRVSYTTKPHGIMGSIDVPEEGYNLENVKALLEKAAETDEAIASH